ncbi:hypothetical protein GCM10023311_20550 [Flaviramulus aquimarinus]|uniref:Uncharacterized protein n=1 Tax=Flaviramulus aquimarinus TaxID=1170456 RepID=A0ABP9F824_9FLAO
MACKTDVNNKAVHNTAVFRNNSFVLFIVFDFKKLINSYLKKIFVEIIKG